MADRNATCESGIHAVGVVLQAIVGLKTASKFVTEALDNMSYYCAEDADQVQDMIRSQGFLAHRLVVKPDVVQRTLLACWKQRQLVVFQVRSIDDEWERRWAVLEGVEGSMVKYAVCLLDGDGFKSEEHPHKCATGEAVIVDYRIGETQMIVARAYEDLKGSRD